MVHRPRIRSAAVLGGALLGCNAMLDNRPRQLSDPAQEAAETADAAAADAASDDAASDAEEPADIPGEMLLWLAADRGVGADEQGAVTTWADQSGHAHDALPPHPDAAPHLGADQVLVFDGDDELSLPAFPAFSGLSFFAVARARAPGDSLRCPSILHLSNVDVGVHQVQEIEFGRHQRELYYEVEQDFVTADPASAGTFPLAIWHLLSVTHSADGDVLLRVDGQQTGAGQFDAPASVARADNFIGNNHFFFDALRPQCDGYVGEIAEILLYPRGLGDDERARVERYLDAKWQVGAF